MRYEALVYNLPMDTDALDGLLAVLAVARHESFTRAAAEMRVSPTAMSQKIKAVEQRLGALLFRRTTRSVALTEAGAAFVARVGPATREIEDAIGALGDYGGRPSGTLRITAPRISASTLVAPLVAAMRAAHPAIVLEISLDDAFVDIVEAGFDAGIREGDAVAKDMIRVRMTESTGWSIVGARSYFEARGRPRTVDDLVRHEAVRQRFPKSKVVYRWELVHRGRDVTVDVPGVVVVDDVAAMIALARDGIGLAYVPDALVEGDLAAGTLERVLEANVTRGPGFCLYFPARAQTQPKMRALVDVVGELSRKKAPRGKGQRARAPTSPRPSR